ncbi:MAG: sensor histidine kinase [Limimaricola sp.]|uniref:sensor histidine kinase n=1 Tax=Limimaricola sp. TaxID=2211665 RepID=UPI001DD87BF4|nr:ATP-binding protein [Limimaricola sp.]MBI1416856.1 sensor histidine kinase [Limimaricola sp.]
MTAAIVTPLAGMGTERGDYLARQMKDYAKIGMKLTVQRHAIYIAAATLAGWYYSVWLAAAAASLMAISEVFDLALFRAILRWRDDDSDTGRRYLTLLYISTVLSAAVIIYYAVAIAVQQGPAAHFMSLFFLFAAALFAAMNNHQLLPLLIIRLCLYGAAFIAIPVRDLILTKASIESELWAQFFTSVFVLYFVVDCSRIYLTLYRKNFNQMQALKIQNRKAEEASQAKTEFLSTMSHELRTPLTSIKGSIDVLHGGHIAPLPDTAISMLSVAQRNCTRLINLIDEILDLQRIESGKMEFDFEPIEVESFVAQVLSSNTPFAARLGVTLRAAPISGPLFVMADRTRLEQVMANILSNAAKFSPEGGAVEVRVERHGKNLRISVNDEGVGLQESDRERVFEKFSQVDASDTRKIGGTGLGMNISKEIMLAHGGLIDFTPNIGRGTTFFIELPLVDGVTAQTLAAE